MNQEFITAYGKVIEERSILHIRTLKMQFSNSALGLWLWASLPPLAIVINIFEPDPFKRFVRVTLFSIMFFNNIKLFYELLVKRTFTTRIPLSKVRRYEVLEDENKLEVHVKIFLASGRFRKITFRVHENGFAPFTQMLDNAIGQPQYA